MHRHPLRPACPASAFFSVQHLEQHQYRTATTTNNTSKLHRAPLVLH
uniref:Uncharacterized protein n=1 Tax=Populus trichocarpa TaxID=3694 RepID=A0A3N7EJ10_POPTR